ncbi:hypothetical protein [Candidatus Methylacidiphilum infernorum]|nr:hypothetical protein [Candidatus Methylacidiphilum infernorum]
MMADGLNLLKESFQLFLGQRPLFFWLTLVFSLFVAGCCWWLASHYTLLWNRTFRVKLLHHCFCAVASLFSFVFVSTFVCLGFAKTAARDQVSRWGAQLILDVKWRDETFNLARNKVWNLGIEHPNAWTDPHFIPATQFQSRLAVATVFTTQAAENFLALHPFLGAVLHLDIRRAEELAKKDMDSFFNQGGNTYYDTRSVELISRYLIWSLDQQTPRLSFLFRLGLVVGFLFIQSLPFGLIGIAAYKDIKVES